jgi:hydroxymethylpyrimidine/phosphomethylpyrimidine kinase
LKIALFLNPGSKKSLMKTVLTIAGFDPSSGAGITADLMVFAANGLFGTSCITSLTVQSTLEVVSTHPVSPEILDATLDCLAQDLLPAGIKIGMLSTAGAVGSVARFLIKMRMQEPYREPHIPVVLDPVLRSTLGRELLEPAGVDLLRSELLPLVDWVTPNLEELASLTGLAVESREQISDAARALQRMAGASNAHPINVLATAGHLDPPDDLLLTDNSEAVWLPGRHIESTSTHGTGCALSSALLSRLVLGDEPHAAAVAAKRYVAEAIRSATPMGRGRGPLNHLWPLKSH